MHQLRAKKVPFEMKKFSPHKETECNCSGTLCKYFSSCSVPSCPLPFPLTPYLPSYSSPPTPSLSCFPSSPTSSPSPPSHTFSLISLLLLLLLLKSTSLSRFLSLVLPLPLLRNKAQFFCQNVKTLR